MSGTYSVVVGDRGRVVIPAELRERAGMSPGSPLILIETPDGLVLLTRDQLRRRINQQLERTDVVSQLLSERREASTREDADERVDPK